MLIVRKSDERGHFDHGWLDTRHTFSFADYHDPAFMGFRHLRVINEDRVQPGQGFGTHPHRDMEILTYVISGALEHQDSMGNGSIIRPGDVQRMTAGTGVLHSEFNPSSDEPVHFLQIWILPEQRNLAPGYEQKSLPALRQDGTLALVASRDGRDGSMTVHQDVALFAARMRPGQGVVHSLATGRHAWVQVAAGNITLNGQPLSAGDGAALVEEPRAELKSESAAEVLVFDLV